MRVLLPTSKSPSKNRCHECEWGEKGPITMRAAREETANEFVHAK